MNLLEPINIKNVVVHILNSKENLFRVSEYEIEQDANLLTLINKSIMVSLKHDSRRFAKFTSSSNIVKKCSIEIFNNENRFVEQSKIIAGELYKGMRGTNASPANFLIVRYQQGINQALAFLKFDFNANFHTEEVVIDGKLKIVVKVTEAGFNKKQRLQKCAFIYDNILGDEDADIIILDKQSRDDVSNYFSSTFLDSQLVLDDRVNTETMIDESMRLIKEKYIEDPKEMLSKTYAIADYFIRNDEFDIEDLTNQLFSSEEAKTEFKEKLANTRMDFTFNIAKPSIEKRLTKRKFITTSGIVLQFNESLYDSNSICVGQQDTDGFVDITIKKVKIIK